MTTLSKKSATRTPHVYSARSFSRRYSESARNATCWRGTHTKTLMQYSPFAQVACVLHQTSRPQGTYKEGSRTKWPMSLKAKAWCFQWTWWGRWLPQIRWYEVILFAIWDLLFFLITNYGYWLPDTAKAREWASFIPDNVSFKNAYRVRKLKDDDDEQRPVPHAFTFMPRSGQTWCVN